MTQIGAIRVLEDEAFLRRAARGSFAILGVALLLILAWLAIGSAIPGFPRLELERALGGWGARLMGVRAVSAWAVAGWWIALLFGCAASFVLHEVVHGLFFERFLPAGHAVSYGIDFKMGIMYASAEGVRFERDRYVAVLIAPTIVITLAVVAIGIGFGWPLWTLATAAIHLSGCTGDWGYIRAIHADRRIAYCEDTSWGVAFFADDGALSSGHGVQPSCAKGFKVIDGGLSGADGPRTRENEDR